MGLRSFATEHISMIDLSEGFKALEWCVDQLDVMRLDPNRINSARDFLAHLRAQEEPVTDPERIAQLIAHRACCGTEHDPENGKLHGYCVVCGVPWPCGYAAHPPTEIAAPSRERQIATLFDAIKHDDEKHQQWLRDQISLIEHIASLPIAAAVDVGAWHKIARGFRNIAAGYSNMVEGDHGGVRKLEKEYDALDKAMDELLAHPAPVAQEDGWQPISTAPKGELTCIWINSKQWSEQPEMWAYCYYDNICGEWRTTRPSGYLRCVPERFVTHWRPIPTAPPKEPAHE